MIFPNAKIKPFANKAFFNNVGDISAGHVNV